MIPPYFSTNQLDHHLYEDWQPEPELELEPGSAVGVDFGSGFG